MRDFVSQSHFHYKIAIYVPPSHVHFKIAVKSVKIFCEPTFFLVHHYFHVCSSISSVLSQDHSHLGSNKILTNVGF